MNGWWWSGNGNVGDGGGDGGTVMMVMAVVLVIAIMLFVATSLAFGGSGVTGYIGTEALTCPRAVVQLFESCGSHL